MSATPQAASALPPRAAKSPGEIYEGIAFTLCKAATVALFVQLLANSRYILPFVALSTALYYVLALSKGKQDTRCILRLPWLIILFWGAIGAYSLYLTLSGKPFPSLITLP